MGFTAVTALLISVAGLMMPQIYTVRLNRITAYELMGQNTVTAFMSALFILLLLFMDAQRIKTRIIRMGFLLYFFYMYAYFSFGGVSGSFYLLFVALTGLTFYLFAFDLIDLIRNQQFPVASDRYPAVSISVFLFISILMVTVMEMQDLVSKTILRPEPLNPFDVFYVLDLAIIFPMIIIAAVLNLKRTGPGVLLSGVALIKIVTILPAVVLTDVFHRLNTGEFLDLSFDVMALVITGTGALLLGLYLQRIKG